MKKCGRYSLCLFIGSLFISGQNDVFPQTLQKINCLSGFLILKVSFPSSKCYDFMVSSSRRIK